MIDSDDYLLVSGGDDNALYAATFRLNLSSPLAILPTDQCLETNAHISSITGTRVVFLEGDNCYYCCISF